MRLLLVEDEKRMAEALCEILRLEKYEVDHYDNGVDGLSAIETDIYDIIILDVMLPGLNGFEIVRRARSKGLKTPILMLTAKAELDDKVTGLDCGADDYLTKPFDTKELVARIAVQLRKSESDGRAKVLKTGKLVLDEESHEVSYNGEPIKITKTEYAVLKILMSNQNRTISKSGILDKISEDTPDCTEDSLKQHISNLRVKIRDISGKDMIQAIWGIGYKLITE